MPSTKNARDQETEGKQARELLTSPTPALSALKVGRTLTMKSRGKEFAATVVKEGGSHRLRVAAIKDKVFGSLSGAAMAVTGLTGRAIAQRGAVAWGLMKQPNYAALAGASPAPAKPKAKKPAAKKRSAKAPTHGKVKSKWECGNCHQKFPTKAKLTAHVGRDHKEAK